MNIRILTFGTKVSCWVKNGFDEYKKRLERLSINIQLIELSSYKTRNKNVALLKEEKLLLSKISHKDYLIVLDINAEKVTSIDFSEKFKNWQQKSDITFIIGGSNGLSNNLKLRANECISLSGLTFSHHFVRVILIEQIYRSWSILSNHPYHK